MWHWVVCVVFSGIWSTVVEFDLFWRDRQLVVSSMLELLLVVALCVALLFMTNVGRTAVRMCRNGYLRLFAVGVFLAVLVACLWTAAIQLHLLHSPDELPGWSGGVKPEAHGNYFYGIMFDAGSTGSRIHVYKFRHAGSTGSLISMNYSICFSREWDCAENYINDTINLFFRLQSAFW